MAAPEARFCRLCGAPLRLADESHDSVSPLAQTVPLSGEGRATDNFAPGEQKRSAETSRVRREEIEHLLRRPHAEETHQEEEYAGPIIIPVANAYVAPNTNELEGPSAPAQTPALPAEVQKRAESRAVSRRFPLWLAFSGLVLVSLAAAIFFLARDRGDASGSSRAPSPNTSPSISTDVQLTEAEALLAAGQTEAALTRLRTLVQLEPSNERAHKLLGNALERSGQRREAIAEYLSATRLDANDAAAWRALAAAQFAEELYADAVESYRHLVALVGEDGMDDNARLEYADALRQAGYSEDARQVYRKVEATAPADLARKATTHLSELTPVPTGTPSIAADTENINARAAESVARDTHAESARGNSNRPAEGQGAQALASPSPLPAQPLPAPQGSPATDSAGKVVAQTDPDAYYFQALSIVNGRQPESLPRPLLLRALQLFQNAAGAKGGAHRGEAQKYAERLGREYDRRSSQKK